MRIFFRNRVKTIWNSFGVKLYFSQNSSGVNPYSSGVDQYFMEVFRGECNFSQSLGVRRLEEKVSPQPVGGGGGGTDIKN